VRVLVSPGQGAQKPGLLLPWLDLPYASVKIDRWSELTGIDLLEHGTKSSAETIRDTAIAQVLLTATALLSFEAVDQPFELLAGHSVGEFSACAIAGVLTLEDCLRAVAARGRAMAQCAAANCGGMAAVVGATKDETVRAITRAGAEVANFNGPRQIVAGGSSKALAALAANPPPAGRVIRLDVAGAFHTAAMKPAEASLREALANARVSNARVPIVTNADGRALTDGKLIVENLITQVSRPVRWDLVLDTFVASGVTHHLELAPSGVLSGIAKRAMPGVCLERLLTPSDGNGATLQAIEKRNH
jgi:[acyl-carrier-protein] S-malonyltransferase